ncbi:MAG TPA: hypothetical protein VJT54_06880, partial [Verrucomicrobiae bacterium]|nr:hypothetical protein [Verrucomicrobiae bacterium]
PDPLLRFAEAGEDSMFVARRFRPCPIRRPPADDSPSPGPERCSWATAKVAATPCRQHVNTTPTSHFYMY